MSSFGLQIVLVLGLLALPSAVYGAQHVVGDSGGWTTGGDYTTWVSGKTFAVGDTLLFNYGSFHSVDVVSKADYDSCSTSNAITSYSDGGTSVDLTKAGSMYFICGTPGHCSGGMKLAVTVAAAGTPTPTTPSGTPTTPSTGSPPATTTPGTDTGSTTEPSSSPAAIGGLLISSSLVLATIFGVIMV